jgi:hypothetical protein
MERDYTLSLTPNAENLKHVTSKVSQDLLVLVVAYGHYENRGRSVSC